jgi:uncharacterized protein with NRDE domain
MCTVSYVRTNDAAIITSNRDEHIRRENAAAPDFHDLPNKKIIFPRDTKAGGTWFAAADNGTVAVLLNGAFKKHLARPPYRKSRGLILLEIIEAEAPLSFFRAFNLQHIEPFTVVLNQPGSLHELRWDGVDKHEKSLDIQGRYIWSSATLYTDEVIAFRENLFKQFVSRGEDITADAIHDFHAGNNGDHENGFVINRQTGMITFSISQVVVKDDVVEFSHHDLLQQKIFKETMPMGQLIIKNIREEI